MNQSILPQLGHLFREVITAAGYRRRLTNRGRDKDLDDRAMDVRPSSSAELLVQLEDVVQKALAEDSGEQWARVLRWAWGRTRESLQGLSRKVDTTPLAPEEGIAAVSAGLGDPMLSALVRLVVTEVGGIDLDVWWRSPVAAWVKMAADASDWTAGEVVARLHDTPRTTERWLAGEPVGDLQFPYRAVVVRVCGVGRSSEEVDRLTGWLTFAVAFQSLPASRRDAVRRDYELRKQHPWSLEDFVGSLKHQAMKAGARPIRERAIPLLQQIQQSFAARPRDFHRVSESLEELRELIDQEPEFWRHSYDYLHDWMSGRLAALQGRREDALRLYQEAVDGVWWRGGANQHPILHEALLYAVGVGEQVAAKAYWDKTFMLGLDRWPKRPFDEQERRRLAFAFEKMFSPQVAKDRIPPRLECIVRDGPIELSARQLKKPNAKAKHAEGRTRRTPLMDAIREGTLEDVKRAIKAGGDPNDFIEESGEGPLSYAMRRACDRRDTLIMDYLLRLELLPETVKREASTNRETPLKIAIEMANAAAVERLLELGADVEHPCVDVPSALCYAMSLLYGSIYRDDPAQERAYLTGRTRADVHDAKDGAALGIELSARRRMLAALRDASPDNRAMFDAVVDWHIRPPEAHRGVIKTLLRLGANPNRRYKVDHEDLAEWTPTLAAAQVGDLEVFERMVECGGDPDQVLWRSPSLDRKDALWVAVQYGRHAVVDFLIKRAAAGAAGNAARAGA